MKALADTSLFIGREQRPDATANPPDELVVSVITVAELRLGVLMAKDLSARGRRLDTLRLAESIEPLPIDDRVATVWSRLVAELRAAGRRAPVNDSWIAATARAHDLPVATQDGDYETMPGISVIRL